MIAVKLSYIAAQLGWRLLGDDQIIGDVVTDSRTVKSGDCFVALHGDKFDAHQFIDSVVELGAKVLIVSQEQQCVDHSISQLIVDDTRVALGQLGGLNRQLSGAKFVAITGSCGKTTVKEMLAAILSHSGKVLSTAGNFNNDIGVPLTLLRLTKECQFGVIELGANHLGEIDYTSALVKPDVALITNVGAAHLAGFGSIDGVFKAKSEIFNHLGLTGCAIFDNTSEYSAQWLAQNKQRDISTISSDSAVDATIFARDIRCNNQGQVRFVLHTPSGAINISLALPGLHNVDNALTAAAAALALGGSLDDIATGLRLMNTVAGRLNVTQLTDSLTVIDDTYNANTTSIAAAVQMLGQYQGQRILVLGDMGELGDYAVACHQELGPVIEQHNIDLLLTFGHFSHHYATGFTGRHYHFEDKQSLNRHLNQHLNNQQCANTTTVLVKGSRSAKMEQVVAFITEHVVKQANGGQLSC